MRNKIRFKEAELVMVREKVSSVSKFKFLHTHAHTCTHTNTHTHSYPSSQYSELVVTTKLSFVITLLKTPPPLLLCLEVNQPSHQTS